MADQTMWREGREHIGPYGDYDRNRSYGRDRRREEQRSFGEGRREMQTGGGVYGTPDYEGYDQRERRGWGRSDDRDRDRDQGQDRDWGGAYRYGQRDNARFGNADENRRVPRDETERLIASDKVEGTRVYDRNGDRLGAIENFMVGKRSGKVEYAVLSFGGFMGMGERHYPLPWDQLTYDERLGGYVVDMDERDLQQAPSHRAGEQPRYEGRYGTDIQGYYGQSYYGGY